MSLDPCDYSFCFEVEDLLSNFFLNFRDDNNFAYFLSGNEFFSSYFYNYPGFVVEFTFTIFQLSCLFFIAIVLYVFRKNFLSYLGLFSVISCVFLMAVCSIFSIPHFAFSCGALENNFFLFFWKIIFLIFLMFLILSVINIADFDKSINYEYVLIVYTFSLSAVLFMCSVDSVSLFLSAELQSFCTYVLVSFHRTSDNSIEAGIKYFIFGSIASSLLLFGGSFIYVWTASVDLYRVLEYFFFYGNDNLFIVSGIWFFLIGFFFKISMFPFHFWVPDVYQGTSYVILLFLSILSKLVGLIVLIRFSYSFFYELFYTFQNFLYVCSLFTFLIGLFLSLSQSKIKRFLAYSSMSHIGFIGFSLSVDSVSALYSSFYYIIVYLFLSFFLINFFLDPSSYSLVYKKIISINQMHSFSTMPLIKIIALFAIIFSMAGIPPLWGFLPKFQFFLSMSEIGLNSLALFFMVFSVFSAFYYFRLGYLISYDRIRAVINSLNPSRFAVSVNWTRLVSISFFFSGLSLVFNLFFSIFQEFLVRHILSMLENFIL